MNLEINNTDLPCWSCDGKTSAAYYTTPIPHLYCFKCGEKEYKKRKLEEYFSMDTLDLLNKEKSNQGSEQKASNFVKGTIEKLEDRRISYDAANKYKVESIYKPNETTGEYEIFARAFPYMTETGELVAQKVKKPNKEMRCIGHFNEANLFGQSIFPAGGKYITITEGEEDALATYEMLKTRSTGNIEPAVVSIKSGASSAKRDCQHSWEYLNSFETIVLCFDNDEPGQKAAKEVADLFPNKVKIVKMDLKDANEYLKAGRATDFMTAWRMSEKHTPQGIIPSSSLWKDMVEEDKSFTIPYPWKGLQDKLQGMRTGELVVWKAPPKIGKTAMFRALSFHIHKTTNETVGLIYLEETKKQIGMGLCALEMNKPLQFPDCEYTLEELKTAYDKILGSDRFFIFDPQSERSAKNVFSKIMHFVKAYNCRFIFLDHVSMLAYDEMGIDERKFLDKLFKDLKDLTTSLDIHISAVTHVNDDGKTRGSRAAYQLCDALIDLSRDKLNEDPVIANTTILTVEENRITGDSGVATKLFFNRETGGLVELDEKLTVQSKLKDVKFDS